MTKAHDQAVTDEATAEQRYQAGLKPKAEVPTTRTPTIDLRAADAFAGTTLAVQASQMDLETKKVFELLISEIRAQLGGESGGTAGPQGPQGAQGPAGPQGPAA